MAGKAVSPVYLFLACGLALLIAGAAHSGPVLDEIINPMFKDQSVPMGFNGISFQPNRGIFLTRDNPIGQVFVAGLEADRLVRVWTYIECNSNWQPGEGVTMTIYDAPDKKTPLGSYTIWYEFRGFAYSTAEFFFNITIAPGKTYYMELTHAGAGDGVLGPVGVMNGSSNYDIMSNVIYVNPEAPDGGDGTSWAKAFNSIQDAIDARDTIPAGQGYLGGKVSDFDLCFQTHVKGPPDKTGNLKRMFARFNLELPELAKAREAVRSGAYETAIARIVDHFNKRKTPTQLVWDVPIPWKNKDMSSADLAKIVERGEYALQNIFHGDTGYGYVGPDINWRPHVNFDANGNPIASAFTMNRWGPRGALADAYVWTGHDKYAKKLNDLLIDYFLDNPPPRESGIGGAPSDDVWASLNVGIRLAQKFTAYDRIHKSPSFTNDCRLAYILNLADLADTLIWNGVGAGGNWSVTQNTAMMEHALDFPEFARSEFWYNTSESRIHSTILTDFLEDGIENESAPGYQRWMVYNPLVALHRLLLDRGKQTPFSVSLKPLLENFAEYFMYLYMPNLATPEFGDWGDAAPQHLVSDSELYNRPDMLYVWTKGAEGTKPAETFRLYPYFGTVTMRSHWGDGDEPFDQSRYMFFHGVNIGGHGHNDLNSLTAYAYGKELLTDPGSYIYGSGEHNLLVESVSHNLMTVNGQNQGGKNGEPFRNFCGTPVADYVSFRLPNAYSTGDYQRDVFFIRTGDIPSAQDYWIVRDTAYGSGNASLQQRWHFNPTTVTMDGTTAKTGYADGGNLAIMQVTPARLTVEETSRPSWRPRGNDKPPVTLPNIIYHANQSLPASLDTVLFPYNGPQMPQAQLIPIETSSNGRSSTFKMVQGDISDLFVLQPAVATKTVSSENISFDAEQLFLRKVNGVVRSLLLINGRSLTVDGQQIVDLPSRLAWYAVSYDAAGNPTVHSPSMGTSPIDDIKIIDPPTKTPAPTPAPTSHVIKTAK